MFNRRLAAAAALSLGFHAVVITAVGFSVNSVPESTPGPARHTATSVRLNTVSAVITEPLTEITSPPPAPPAAPQEEPVSASAAITAPEPEPSISPAADQESFTREQSDEYPVGESGGIESDPAEMRSGRDGRLMESGPSITPGMPLSAEPLLVTTINPVYPVLARRLGVEGVVVLDVVIDPGGVPIECIVIPPRVHKVLEESALAAVMQARFKPGMQDGRPIQDTYRLKVRFELET